MRTRIVGAAVLGGALTVALVAGAYGLGTHHGRDEGRRQGSASALAGVNPGDLALVRQLAADRALPAPPLPAAAITGARAVTAAGSATAAYDAAHGYLDWLQAHPDTAQPALLTRLVGAKVALPAGALLTQMTGPVGGSDSDGLVQVGLHGALACVDITLDRIDTGACYVGGSHVDTKGGDYSLKRYPPAYRAAE